MYTPNYVRERTMEHKGFKAQIMEAIRLRGEGTFELPTGTAMPVYPSDAFLTYPEAWMASVASEISLGAKTALEAKMTNTSGGRGFSKSLSKTSSHSLMSPISDGAMDASLVKEDVYRSERSVELPKSVKEVSIGAGAKIRQTLNADSYPLDSWHETPDAVMTIYFVFQEKFEELRAGGMRDLEGVKNGMLEGLPVG